MAIFGISIMYTFIQGSQVLAVTPLDLRNCGSVEARMLDECWAGCMGCKIPWLSLWSNNFKVGWLALGSLCLFEYIPPVSQFYPFLNHTSVSRLLPRVKTNWRSHVFIIMQQDKKRKQRNTFISIWPKETGQEDWFGRPFLARMRQRCQFTSFSYS